MFIRQFTMHVFYGPEERPDDYYLLGATDVQKKPLSTGTKRSFDAVLDIMNLWSMQQCEATHKELCAEREMTKKLKREVNLLKRSNDVLLSRARMEANIAAVRLDLLNEIMDNFEVVREVYTARLETEEELFGSDADSEEETV